MADRTFPRLVGLLGTPDLRPDEAVVITRCAAVHAVGMRVSIGVAFVDRQGVVVRVVDPLPRRGARMRGATTVIEATAGVLAGVTPGVRVHLPNVHLFPHRGPFTRG
ncbi:MAG: DUF192 domain-containing protein [Thermoleophilia bacterium]|nr:DUF192 domain-containing protein [Thermoleophilia bacterium]